MPVVTIQSRNTRKTIIASKGELLQDVLHSAGVFVSSPCGGNHTCGKCRVYAAGSLSEMGKHESTLLFGAPKGTRLSCFASVLGDCSIRIPDEGAQKIVTEFRTETMELNPIYSGSYGVAFDIGTTTIAGYLFSRERQEPICVCGEMNDQRIFGADVMTRIAYANEHTEKTLSEAIRSQLGRLLCQMCIQAGISTNDISAAVLTGNTTMLHLLTDLPVRSLAIAPFHTVSLFGDWHALKLGEAGEIEAYLPRCISAYVGADITCGILASGLFHSEENAFLIDAGTNGEIVLRYHNALVCCSTAAGPAFEGAGISQGSCAVCGAINKVDFRDGKVRYSALCDAPAVSVCGSGLIEAVAAFLQAGWVDRSGRMIRHEENRIEIGNSGVFLTQGDIRQLQLAKGAIRAGMDTLVRECATEYDQLQSVLLCGGFGSYLDPLACVEIGLIDAQCLGKTVAIGNAAGKGAAMILQSREAFAQALSIADAAKTIELSSNAYFMKRFIQAMRF